jgi:hypothetical protein
LRRSDVAPALASSRARVKEAGPRVATISKPVALSAPPRGGQRIISRVYSRHDPQVAEELEPALGLEPRTC